MNRKAANFFVIEPVHLLLRIRHHQMDVILAFDLISQTLNNQGPTVIFGTKCPSITS